MLDITDGEVLRLFPGTYLDTFTLLANIIPKDLLQLVSGITPSNTALRELTVKYVRAYNRNYRTNSISPCMNIKEMFEKLKQALVSAASYSQDT